ncbi:TolC family protein [Flavisolibacter sp. BT320]|nr:TolC family protein [Flavisolibacter longurius]
MNKSVYTVFAAVLLSLFAQAQKMTMQEIKDSVQAVHPSLKMYEAEIRSMDAAAKGAWSWMPPEGSTGFFMTPYNPKYIRKTDMGEGMGQYTIALQQMFPNKKRQAAEYNYMSAMSSVEKERKQAALNNLIADAKKNYYEWAVLKKKLSVLDQNEKLLEFMIKNAEIRYKNGLGKISAYYKAKAALGNLQNMRLMFENDIRLRRINLNTLMNRDKDKFFEIDTTVSIKDYTGFQFDSSAFVSARSDLRALERGIQIVGLQQQLERARFKPEFGIRFEHMIGLGGQPAQYSAMAMFRLPFTSWASRMNRANIESLQWRRESIYAERQMLLNELSGMAGNMRTEYTTKRRQLKLYEENIIPALQNNYRTMQLGYEQNTEELFELYDAWETLNMAQLEYLEQLQQLFSVQVELERILEIK